MKRLIPLALVLLTQAVTAETFEGQIHSIVKGSNGEPHIVKLASGEVRFIENDQVELLARLEKKIDQRDNIPPKNFTLVEPEFQPTAVPDNQLNAIFNRMNPFMRRRSECSDRAHVWAWDEFNRSGIQSEKAFLFLTDTYIRRHRYKWWFHVAPMYTTTSGKKMVMDFQFLNRPVTFTQWKNNLVFSKRDCVTEFSFLEYDAGADQTQDCYTKAEPMYYRLPGDIGARERGTPRTQWNASEVNGARTRAFYKGAAL